MPEEEVQEKKPGRRRRAGEEDQEPNVSPPQRKVLEGGWGFGDGGNSAADAKKAVDRRDVRSAVEEILRGEGRKWWYKCCKTRPPPTAEGSTRSLWRI